MKALQKFGSEVQQHRRELGLTQSELAEIVGVTQSTVSHIETGKHAPSYRTHSRVLTVIDILDKHYGER